MTQNKAKRKSLSKKVRFEVFKRDSFQCQYCGASAPDEFTFWCEELTKEYQEQHNG